MSGQTTAGRPTTRRQLQAFSPPSGEGRTTAPLWTGQEGTGTLTGRPQGRPEERAMWRSLPRPLAVPSAVRAERWLLSTRRGSTPGIIRRFAQWRAEMFPPPMPACRCSDHMAGVGVVSEAGVGAPQWVSRGRPAAVVVTDTGLTPNRGAKAGRGRVRQLLQNRPTTKVATAPAVRSQTSRTGAPSPARRSMDRRT